MGHYFITGGLGFIGTHLTNRLLKEGHKVIVLDDLSHPCKWRVFHNDEFIEDDVCNIRGYYKQAKKCDWIIHLAAQINVEESLKDPMYTCYANFTGTLEVLEMARKLNKPLIFASSTEIYGDKQSQKGMNENHIINPKSPYAASKAGADALCKAYFHSYGTKVIIVRNFNTFGAGQNDDKWGAVIAKFADQISKGEPVTVFGDGTQKRDFMGYKDAIDFYMLLLRGKGKWGESYNVGMGKNISINELAKTMVEISGKKVPIIHTKPRPGEVKEFLCNNKKARSLGWKPNTNFRGLLKDYMEWKEEYDN